MGSGRMYYSCASTGSKSPLVIVQRESHWTFLALFFVLPSAWTAKEHNEKAFLVSSSPHLLALGRRAGRRPGRGGRGRPWREVGSRCGEALSVTLAPDASSVRESFQGLSVFRAREGKGGGGRHRDAPDCRPDCACLETFPGLLRSSRAWRMFVSKVDRPLLSLC